MGRRLLLSFVALTSWALALAAPAWSEDAPASDPTKEMIREEIDAYFKEQKSDFRVFWKDGLNFETRDKKFKANIGGRLFADFVFYPEQDDVNLFNETGADEFHSGFEFRTARLEMAATMYKYTGFKVQIDFAENEVELKDVYLKFGELDECWGCLFPDIYVGKFKEFFSLEELTSSRFITFMERALPVQAFSPSRNPGVGFTHDVFGGRGTYGVGWFVSDQDYFGASGAENGNGLFKDGQAVTARLTFLPWAPCGCESRFWHVGLSGSYRFDYSDGFRYRARPEIHLADRVVDVRIDDAQEAIHLGAETAFVWDRFRVQAEYIAALPDVAGDPMFSGYYAYASYFLNGPGHSFKRETASFDKTKPCENFDCTGCGKWGAFELAARYASIDLQDAGFDGGTSWDATLGLNWYWNPNVRIMFNYVYSDTEDFKGEPGIDGQMHLFGVRFEAWW